MGKSLVSCFFLRYSVDLSHRAYNLLVGELYCGHNFIKCPVFSACALTLLVGWQVGHTACKKTEWWGACMVICLERGADLHLAQLMPLPLTVSCFSKTQIGFTFLLPAHLGSPGQRAVKWVCVCLVFSASQTFSINLYVFECVGDVLVVGNVQVVAVCRLASLMAWRAVYVTQVASFTVFFISFIVILCFN